VSETTIPSKQIHRKCSTVDELERKLSPCEIGLCTSDNMVYMMDASGNNLIPVRGYEMTSDEVEDIVNLCD
jgi:hypothetical protein